MWSYVCLTEGEPLYWPTKVAVADKPPLDIGGVSSSASSSSSVASSLNMSTNNNHSSHGVSVTSPAGDVSNGWADIDLDLDAPISSPATAATASSSSSSSTSSISPPVLVDNTMIDDDLLGDLPIISSSSSRGSAVTPLHRRAGSDASESLLREVDALLGEVDPLSPLPNTQPNSDSARAAAAAAAAEADLFSLSPPATPVPATPTVATATISVSPSTAAATSVVVTAPLVAVIPSVVPIAIVSTTIAPATLSAPVAAPSSSSSSSASSASASSFSYFDNNANDHDAFGVTEDDFLAAAPSPAIPVSSPSSSSTPAAVPSAASVAPPASSSSSSSSSSRVASVASSSSVTAPSAVATSSSMDYFGAPIGDDDLFGGAAPSSSSSAAPTSSAASVGVAAPSSAPPANNGGAFSYFGDTNESDAWLAGNNSHPSHASNNGTPSVPSSTHGHATAAAAVVATPASSNGGFSDYFSTAPVVDEWNAPVVPPPSVAVLAAHNSYGSGYYNGGAPTGNVNGSPDWQYGADPFPPVEPTAIVHQPIGDHGHHHNYVAHAPTAAYPAVHDPHAYYGGAATPSIYDTVTPAAAAAAAPYGNTVNGGPSHQPWDQHHHGHHPAAAAAATATVGTPSLPSATIGAASNLLAPSHGSWSGHGATTPPVSAPLMTPPLPQPPQPLLYDHVTRATTPQRGPVPPPVGMLPQRGSSYDTPSSSSSVAPVLTTPTSSSMMTSSAFDDVPLSPRGHTSHTTMMSSGSIGTNSGHVMASPSPDRPYTPRICATASFGFGGQLITVYPRVTPGRYGDVTRGSPIYIQSVSSLINDTPLGRGLSSFPGPLAKTKDNDRLLAYLSDRGQDVLGSDDSVQSALPHEFKDNIVEDNTSRRMLWLIVRELWHHQATVVRSRVPLTSKDKDGKNDEKKGDNVEQGAIRILLDPSNNTSISSIPNGTGALPHSTSSEWLASGGSGIGGGGPGQPSIRVSPEKSLGGTAPRPIRDRPVNTVAGGLELVDDAKRQDDGTIAVQRLLLSGKRQEACQLAVSTQLWSHALLLASFEPATYTNVLARYALSSFADGTPLQSLYLLFAQQPAALFRGLPSSSDIHDMSTSPPLVRNWKSNVAMMLANPTPNDSAVLVQLADALWAKYGLVSAAHVCYLLAGHGGGALDHIINPAGRVVLIGADHRRGARTFCDPWSIQRSEIMEYARQQLNPMFSLPSLQVYKLVYATLLADLGYTRAALTYSQAVNDHIKEMSTKVKSKAISAAEAPLIAASFTPNFITVAGDLEARLRTLLGDAAGASRTERVAGGLFRLLDRTMSMVLGDGKDNTGSAASDAAAAGNNASVAGGGLAAGYLSTPATATIISSPSDHALIGAHRRASGGDTSMPAAVLTGAPSFGHGVPSFTSGVSSSSSASGNEGQFLGGGAVAQPVVNRSGTGVAPTTPSAASMHPRDLRRLSTSSVSAAPSPSSFSHGGGGYTSAATPPVAAVGGHASFQSPVAPIVAPPHQRSSSLGQSDWSHGTSSMPSLSPASSQKSGTDSPSSSFASGGMSGAHTRSPSESRAPLPSPTSADKAKKDAAPASSPTNGSDTPSNKSGILGRVKGWFGVKEPKRVNLDAAQTKFRYDEKTGRYLFDDDDGTSEKDKEDDTPPPPPPPMLGAQMKAAIGPDGMPSPSSSSTGSDSAAPTALGGMPLMPSLGGNAFAKKAGGVGSRYALANTLSAGIPGRPAVSAAMLGPRMPGDEPFDAGTAAQAASLPAAAAATSAPIAAATAAPTGFVASPGFGQSPAGGPPSRYAPVATGYPSSAGYAPVPPSGAHVGHVGGGMTRSPSDPAGFHPSSTSSYPSYPSYAPVNGGGGGGMSYGSAYGASQMRSTTPHPTRPPSSLPVEPERSHSTPRGRPPMPGMPGVPTLPAAATPAATTAGYPTPPGGPGMPAYAARPQFPGYGAR